MPPPVPPFAEQNSENAVQSRKEEYVTIARASLTFFGRCGIPIVYPRRAPNPRAWIWQAPIVRPDVQMA